MGIDFKSRSYVILLKISGQANIFLNDSDYTMVSTPDTFSTVSQNMYRHMFSINKHKSVISPLLAILRTAEL